LRPPFVDYFVYIYRDSIERQGILPLAASVSLSLCFPFLLRLCVEKWNALWMYINTNPLRWFFPFREKRSTMGSFCSHFVDEIQFLVCLNMDLIKRNSIKKERKTAASVQGDWEIHLVREGSERLCVGKIPPEERK
jgi:hypothetical protein